MAASTTLLFRKEIAKGIVAEKYSFTSSGGTSSVTVTPDQTDTENYGTITNILGYATTDDTTPGGSKFVYNNNLLSTSGTLTFTANDSGTITIWGVVA